MSGTTEALQANQKGEKELGVEEAVPHLEVEDHILLPQVQLAVVLDLLIQVHLDVVIMDERDQVADHRSIIREINIAVPHPLGKSVFFMISCLLKFVIYVNGFV